MDQEEFEKAIKKIDESIKVLDEVKDILKELANQNYQTEFNKQMSGIFLEKRI